jgi:vacuolar-type H+-ATPase subunit I/STV1
MKSQDIKVGVDYAIIPAWDYSSAEKKNAELVTRKHVAKAEVVSLEKYEYKVYRSDNPADQNFTPAPKGSRSVGYLVKSDEWANTSGQGTIYWISRPQDIVAEYATIETRWTRQEAEQAVAEQQEKQRRIDEERKERQMQERAQKILDTTKEALRSIIGSKADSVEFDVRRNRNQTTGEYEPTARVTCDARILQSLIEKVLEARDMVA